MTYPDKMLAESGGPVDSVERVARALCEARGEEPSGCQVRVIDGKIHSATFLDIAEYNVRAVLAALTDTAEEPSGSAWETFSDPSYYNMWCVREVGERRFGHSFHLINGDEAHGLVELLNGKAMRAARPTGTAK